MKNSFFCFLLLVSTSLNAQVKGNGNIISQTFPLETLHTLEINLNARVVIDLQGESAITIISDENIIEHIGHQVINGYMDLTQKKWIEPSGRHRITIGAPALKKLINDAHSVTSLRNMNHSSFELSAQLGSIDLKGEVDHLIIRNKIAKVEAIDFSAQHADITISSWGTVFIHVIDTLKTAIDKKGKLQLLGTPKQLLGDAALVVAEDDRPESKEVKFINFDIKNNSWRRNSFVVVGPKRDGSTFSYGFALFPGQTKKERWTIGSEIFTENRAGKRTLVATITAADENQLVKLFQ